ncbi:MAG: hypothetical protein AB7T17_01815 [Geobacter sp.]
MTSHEERGEHTARPAFDAITTEPVTAPVEDGTLTQLDPVAFQRGMAVIRWRRKLFFATIIAYMPLMWLSNRFFPSFRGMAITFSIWVVILFITALYSALARCPRCGNYFHMHGMSLMYLRRCLHCQLSVKS